MAKQKTDRETDTWQREKKGNWPLNGETNPGKLTLDLWLFVLRKFASWKLVTNHRSQKRTQNALTNHAPGSVVVAVVIAVAL